MPLQLGKGIACRAAKTNFGKAPFLYKGRHVSLIGEDTLPADGKTAFPTYRKSPFPAEAGKRLLRVSRSVLPRRER